MSSVHCKNNDVLYQRLKKKVGEYLNSIKDIGFAELEYASLDHDPQTPEALYETVSAIIDTARELNQIIEQSPSSIYVVDTDLNTLRVNKNFEQLTEVDRKDLLGRNTDSLEEENIFSPSVCSIALKEGCRVVVHQSINDQKEFITAGVPILDENGNIFRIVSNALLSQESMNMSAYLKERKEVDRKNKPVETMIAVSRKMRDVLHIADLVKNTASTIIIEGETGVGKSMLARYIHNTGNRSSHKMMEVNCGAIPAELLESELFGYVSGAFTGADRKGKIGLIELCDGGTILLDEISELPLQLQVKLLHFLQNRKIIRVGGTEEISVDVRVIAATNKSLVQLVEKGEFRQDLYYRLNVVPITIPPLRERKEDIMPAARYFINKYAKLYNKELPVEEKCVEYLESNSWKGNLREFENYIERVVITEGFVSHDGLMDFGIVASEEESRHPDTEKMADMERKMVLEAYEKYGSSYKVAQALGISQSTAYRKIRKYRKEGKEDTSGENK